MISLAEDFLTNRILHGELRVPSLGRAFERHCSGGPLAVQKSLGTFAKAARIISPIAPFMANSAAAPDVVSGSKVPQRRCGLNLAANHFVRRPRKGISPVAYFMAISWWRPSVTFKRRHTAGCRCVKFLFVANSPHPEQFLPVLAFMANVLDGFSLCFSR
jgi:hypothetical protein